MKIFKLICIVFILSGFVSDQAPVKIDDEIIGAWVFSKYEDGLRHYVKKNKLAKDKAGIEFKSDGKFIIRQNVSWCGTPPITYGNYEGVWEKGSDSTLLITYEEHGKKCREEWLVSSFEKEKLVMKRTFYQEAEKNSVERDR
jgi:hypothetical protein